MFWMEKSDYKGNSVLILETSFVGLKMLTRKFFYRQVKMYTLTELCVHWADTFQLGYF